jgi:hypothetical protein
MRGLLRLAGWGGLAMAAVLLAVIAASSGRRPHIFAVTPQPNQAEEAAKAKATAAQAAQFARLKATEEEARRLVEMVRALNADRERLLTRMSAIERKLEDVTGSIERQAKAAPPAAPPATPPSESLPRIAALPPPAAPVEPVAAPPSGLPTRADAAGSPSGTNEADAQQARPAAGVDIGGATSFDGLRTLWNSISAAQSGLFEGLHPVVTVRENKSRAPDLRLIAGPLSDLESATRICTTLAAAKRYCRLVTFEGTALALVAPEPPARPVAATKRPAPRPTRPAP